MASEDERKRERRMNIAVVVLIIVVVPFAVYGAGTLAWSALWAGSDDRLDSPDCHEFQFDAAKWDDTSGDNRAEQANGLANCDLLLGQTRQQVDEMLGPADGSKHRYVQFKLPESSNGHVRRLWIRFKRGEVARAVFVDAPFVGLD